MVRSGKTRQDLQHEIAVLESALANCHRQLHELPPSEAAGEDEAADPSDEHPWTTGQALGTLHDMEERLDTLTEKAPVLIWMTDARGHASYVSEQWCAFTGRTEAEEQGEGWQAHIHPDDRALVERVYAEARTEQSPFRVEYRLRHAEGEYRWLLDSGAPRYDAAGRFAGHIGSRIDITNRKEMEAHLVASKEQAEAMARLKSSFLTNVTHEVRTPLTVILGFTSMLRQGVHADYQRFVHVIERSGRRLLRMLDSLLDLAQLEAGTLRPTHETIVIADLVHSVAETMRPLAEEKGLRFEVATPPKRLRARVDHEVLARVMTHLIDNAIKFTDEGAVRLTADADDDVVSLHVHDTGIGIDEMFLPYMFTPFAQESTGLTRTHQGSGLGLAVSKRLVELMGGSIQVESDKGKGSTFTIRLPSAEAAHVTAPAASAS